MLHAKYKMQNCFVVLDFLLLTRQYASIAIHLAMSSFHNPTMCLEVGVFLRLKQLILYRRAKAIFEQNRNSLGYRTLCKQLHKESFSVIICQTHCGIFYFYYGCKMSYKLVQYENIQ